MSDLASPSSTQQRLHRLQERRQVLAEMRRDHVARQETLAAFLAISDQVKDALDKLSEDLFGKLIGAVETHLTYALQEVLEQPIELKVRREIQAGAVHLRFEIERGGCVEDILKGQGGSVANILSVGLRLFALTTLGESEHRRFIVLDEQDCWLRPDLVPRLVKIIHDAARGLGFQILLVSHHDVSAFQPFADMIYRLTPTPEGVSAESIDRPDTGEGSLEGGPHAQG